jgi:hypothetical protein
MATHRYWRLHIAEVNGSSAVAITELEMAESPGGANVCTGGTASASSVTGSNTADKAFDGSFTSVNTWQTLTSLFNNGLTAWLQYDFNASPRDISEMKISFATGLSGVNLAPKAFSLYYSDDNIRWTRQRSWAEQVFSFGETKTYDTTPISSALITNRVALERKLKNIEAALPQGWYASVTRANSMVRGRNCTRPWRLTPFSGSKRIAGSTTSLGVPLARRVDLLDQKSSQLVERINTPTTGDFEFSELADGTYSLVGVDNTAEQNSVIFAHVAAVP